ncbi:hypothetical protein J8273_8370 [Carpediemonas membranifera]|uniref:CDAN1-interacting nuclease 1 n=1 Tax=Carpediemonas membranifera TaxID=201153 RepID=A0A8J6DYX5_9EUKA|nr:hypothetical protein J8273_8370 [Carpediemonas membranifera]|eukprot:KAG9389696.1 hypothetical protein J8273_8370 [Carpediemonas membranifera]
MSDMQSKSALVPLQAFEIDHQFVSYLEQSLCQVDPFTPLLQSDFFSEYPYVSWRIIRSIQGGVMTNEVIKNTWRHRKKRHLYLKNLVHNTSILDLSRGANFPACRIATFALESLIMSTTPEAFGMKASSDMASRAVLKSLTMKVRRSPGVLDDVADGSVVRKALEQAEEVDFNCSHRSTQAGRYHGLIGEYRLQQTLTNMGAHFATENELSRMRDTYRTPDVLLLTPIVIRGATIHWIDSKAMFGTVSKHLSNFEQLQSYCNLFGPGAVVYWCGFDQAILTDSKLVDDRIVVVDQIPQSSHICVPRLRRGVSFHGRVMVPLDEFKINRADCL